MWPRLNSPYIVWIPQVPVLSVEHEDKRNLIRRGAIFNAISRDLLTSKLVKNIRENWCSFKIIINSTFGIST